MSAATVHTIAPASNALSAFLDDPACILNEDGLIDQLIEELERKHSGLPDDMDAGAARDAVRSAAFEIAKMKKPVDTAAKALTEEYRAKTKAVNDRRNAALEKLEGLQRSIRAPLDQWEAAEKARTDQVAAIMEQIGALGEIPFDATVESIARRIEDAKSLRIDADLFRDEAEAAERRLDAVREKLFATHTRLTKEAAERAELERLRREAEERAAEEARLREEERRKAEAAERAKAEEERQKRLAEQAAEQARSEERERAERQAQEKIRAAEAEAEALRRKEREREEAERRAREEDERRAADQKHRAKVAGEASAALAKVKGMTPELASAVVTAIRAGDVPHISIRF